VDKSVLQQALPVLRHAVPRNKERVLRKLLIGAITGAVMLAVAAIAMAATQTTYSQDYTTNKVNKSAGTHFSTTSIDPENTTGNEQPNAAREVDITFPKGTKIDQKAAPFCKNLDESADQPCPKNTKIGSGSAEVRLKFTGTAPIPASVTAYNRKGGLFLYVVPSVQGQAPVVLKPVFKKLTLVTKIAPLCVLNDCATNGEAVLTSFKLNTNAIPKKAKKGKRTYITTPKTCPKAGWKFTGTFKYDSPNPPKSFIDLQKCKK
jgi:hypothetical protein